LSPERLPVFPPPSPNLRDNSQMFLPLYTICTGYHVIFFLRYYKPVPPPCPLESHCSPFCFFWSQTPATPSAIEYFWNIRPTLPWINLVNLLFHASVFIFLILFFPKLAVGQFSLNPVDLFASASRQRDPISAGSFL